MNDSEKQSQSQTQHHSHSFAVFCSLSVAVSLVLLAASLWLYRVSGAAQLDLSRPGYQMESPATSSESTPDKPFGGSGVLDTAAVDEFLQLYDKKAADITSGDPFRPESLSNASLGISE